MNRQNSDDSLPENILKNETELDMELMYPIESSIESKCDSILKSECSRTQKSLKNTKK